MSYKVIVHRVMISCPSDAYEERDIARDVIYKWISANAEAEKKILLPVDWLRDAVPDAINPPQFSINEQITNKADLLIAVFRHKIGTPTDKFTSGTVEEIEMFMASGKPVLLYFSSEPIPPDLIEQYRSLTEFKDKYRSSSFYGEFLSADDFRQKISQHIQQKAHDFENYHDDNLISSDNIRNYPPLNDLAVDILQNATISGEILSVHYLDGFILQAGDLVLEADSSDVRKRAELEDAIEKLERQGFIKPKSDNHNIFLVTPAGFNFVDSLHMST
jgi:hypothetical protein